MLRRVRIIGMILLLLTVTACSSEPEMIETEPAEKPTEAREWVVKWNGEPNEAFLETVEVLRENEEDQTMLVRVNPDVDQNKWRAKWMLDDNIEYIQPNFQYKLNNVYNRKGEEISAGEAKEPARDYFLEQTYVKKAWEQWKPQREVTIAVVDTGVDTDHPLIAPHLVKGMNIIYPGEAAEDITLEDIRLPEEQGKSDEEIEAMYAEDHSMLADYDARLGAVGHGTGVTGVLLQMLGLIKDGKPVAPTETSAKIMPIKVMGFNNGVKEGGSDFDMSEAIRMAVNRGADIISLSLGDWAYSKNARDAIQLAEQSGVLVVAAAGNHQGGVNEPIFYPAAFPSVLAVGGVTPEGQYDTFSNHGAGMDLVAPDVDIWTTNVGGQAFHTMDGNSFATPQVTAVAAMVMQQNPRMSPAQVRNLLRQTADSSEGRWNEETGYGRLNAYRAITELPQPDIYEQNDNQSTAARVSVNDRIEAVLDGADDEDWYELDIPNLGADLEYRVNVHLKLPRSLDKGVELLVKRPGENELASYPVGNTEDIHLTSKPGEMYIALRFQDGETSRYLGYELETQLSTAPDPYEDNDHQWHAYDLDLTTESLIEGTFHTDGDRDWYRVQTPDPGNLTIGVTAATPRIDPVLFVQQLGGNGVLIDEAGPVQQEQLQIRVEAGGIYYIRVTDLNINPSIGKYRLWVNYEPLVNDMNEPNNSSDQAAPLTGTESLASAALHSSTDYDWYRFKVPEETQVSLVVTGKEGRVEAEVNLYGENLQALGRRTLDPEQKEMTWTQTLPEGEYYVRVRRLSGEETTPYEIRYLLPDLEIPEDKRGAPLGD